MPFLVVEETIIWNWHTIFGGYKIVFSPELMAAPGAAYAPFFAGAALATAADPPAEHAQREQLCDGPSLGEAAARGAAVVSAFLWYRGRRRAVFVLEQPGAAGTRIAWTPVFSFLLAGCAGRLSVRRRQAAPLSCPLSSGFEDAAALFSCPGSGAARARNG